MNTKGIIWEPICMLNAGEGTFCNAGVWVMLQLSPTLSLGGSADAIVLLLHVYHSLFAISACFHSLLAQKPHLIPRSQPDTPLLTLNEFFSPPADEMLHLFPLCGDEMRGRKAWGKEEEQEKKGEERGGITVTDKSAPKQQKCSHTFIRWTGSCCFVITPYPLYPLPPPQTNTHTYVCNSLTGTYEVMQCRLGAVAVHTHAYNVGEQAGFSTFRFGKAHKKLQLQGQSGIWKDSECYAPLIASTTITKRMKEWMTRWCKVIRLGKSWQCTGLEALQLMFSKQCWKMITNLVISAWKCYLLKAATLIFTLLVLLKWKSLDTEWLYLFCDDFWLQNPNLLVNRTSAASLVFWFIALSYT